MRQKIGIAITTRNRSELLAYTLQHFAAFPPCSNWEIVVTDDDSDPAEQAMNEKICQGMKVNYRRTVRRIGIAKNKNLGISFLRQYCEPDFYFLFDDDCMPRAPEWDRPFISLAESHGIEHSMHLAEAAPQVVVKKEVWGLYRQWSNCGGYCLFFTKQAMRSLKGFNPEFRIYGFEHAELSLRAAREGWTAGHGDYLSPWTAKERIYSLDIDLGWHGEVSPLAPFPGKFDSSLAAERAQLPDWIEENRKVFEAACRRQ
jgi:glycosyltransferase involved in cell wall biosynthesis